MRESAIIRASLGAISRKSVSFEMDTLASFLASPMVTSFWEHLSVTDSLLDFWFWNIEDHLTGLPDEEGACVHENLVKYSASCAR